MGFSRLLGFGEDFLNLGWFWGDFLRFLGCFRGFRRFYACLERIFSTWVFDAVGFCLAGFSQTLDWFGEDFLNLGWFWWDFLDSWLNFSDS